MSSALVLPATDLFTKFSNASFRLLWNSDELQKQVDTYCAHVQGKGGREIR